MITDKILQFVLLGARFILLPISSLDNATLDPEFSSSLTTLGGWLHNVDRFLPVFTILIILGLFVVIETGILLYKLIRWGYRKIPGIT